MIIVPDVPEQRAEPPPLELCIRCGGGLEGFGFQVLLWGGKPGERPHTTGKVLVCKPCGLEIARREVGLP